MKQFLSFLNIYTNWRLDIVILLFGIALTLSLCEADSLFLLLLTKVAAVAVVSAGIRLYFAWIDKLPDIDEA
jgi:hypothetical protein